MFPLILKRDEKEEIPRDEPFTYILGRNGPYLQKITPAFRAVVPAASLPMLAEVKQEAEYLLPPIPPEVVWQMLLFFRLIYERYRTEALLFLSYHTARGTFRLDAPPQRVSSAGCQADLRNWKRPPEGFLPVGTAHSHASMSAFHSGTDQHDEEFDDGIHITVGRLDRPAVQIVASLAVSGKRFPQEMERVLGGLRQWTPPKEVPAASQVLSESDLPRVVLGAARARQVILPDITPVSLPAVLPAKSWLGRMEQKLIGFQPSGVRAARPKGQKRRKRDSYTYDYRPAERSTHSYPSLDQDGYVVDLPADVDWRECLPNPDWFGQVKTESEGGWTSGSGRLVDDEERSATDPLERGYYSDGEGRFWPPSSSLSVVVPGWGLETVALQDQARDSDQLTATAAPALDGLELPVVREEGGVILKLGRQEVITSGIIGWTVGRVYWQLYLRRWINVYYAILNGRAAEDRTAELKAGDRLEFFDGQAEFQAGLARYQKEEPCSE
ncbi:hypothetical protein HY628_00630 [Candidatus Uhrbacteria bacterium]|nr:hypothetical protein [Candidatus Uhrbacteria bacterium]